MIVLSVQILLSQLLKDPFGFRLSLIQCSHLIINCRVVLERDGIEDHINFQFRVALIDICSTNGTLIGVLEYKLEYTQLAKGVAALDRNRLDELTQTYTTAYVVVQHIAQLLLDFFIDFISVWAWNLWSKLIGPKLMVMTLN